MTTYIAFLRGINVGGHKKVPMAILRELLSNLGFIGVKTYIQSGNVIFQSSENSINNIENSIAKAILEQFNFKVPIIVKTKAELLKIFNTSPFNQEQKEKSYFIFLNKAPEDDAINEVNSISYPDEIFEIINDCLYFYTSKGYGNTKFNMNVFERKLNVNATSRNYNTIKKILERS